MILLKILYYRTPEEEHTVRGRAKEEKEATTTRIG